MASDSCCFFRSQFYLLPLTNVIREAIFIWHQGPIIVDCSNRLLYTYADYPGGYRGCFPQRQGGDVTQNNSDAMH